MLPMLTELSPQQFRFIRAKQKQGWYTYFCEGRLLWLSRHGMTALEIAPEVTLRGYLRVEGVPGVPVPFDKLESQVGLSLVETAALVETAGELPDKPEPLLDDKTFWPDEMDNEPHVRPLDVSKVRIMLEWYDLFGPARGDVVISGASFGARFIDPWSNKQFGLLMGMGDHKFNNDLKRWIETRGCDE